MKYILLIIFFPVICCDNSKKIGFVSNRSQDTSIYKPLVADTLYINDTLSLIIEGDYTYLRTYLNTKKGGMTIDNPIRKPDIQFGGSLGMGLKNPVDWSGWSGIRTDTIDIINLPLQSIWSKPDVQFGGLLIDTMFIIPDTSRVIMLVSDTVGLDNRVLALNKDGMIVQQGRIWYQYGYEVSIPEIYSEIQNQYYLGENRTCAVWGCTADHSSKTIKVVKEESAIIYLDEHKNPLKKSLVVWMSKEIKQ